MQPRSPFRPQVTFTVANPHPSPPLHLAAPTPRLILPSIDRKEFIKEVQEREVEKAASEAVVTLTLTQTMVHDAHNNASPDMKYL